MKVIFTVERTLLAQISEFEKKVKRLVGIPTRGEQPPAGGATGMIKRAGVRDREMVCGGRECE